MINITTNLLTILLGEIFPAWLSCDAVKVLLSFCVIAYIIRFVFSICSFGGKKI